MGLQRRRPRRRRGRGPRDGTSPIATAAIPAPGADPAAPPPGKPGGRRARAPRGEGDRLRDEILAATEKLLLKTGDESSVSIRAIADAVGVSPPSIYLHFADKEDLIHSVCSLQFGKLDLVVDEAMAGVDDPRERLRLRGRAYVHWGVAHPEHYRIMLMDKSHFSQEDFEAGLLPGMRCFMALIENVQECMDVGILAVDDPFQVATLLWAAVHGMTSLLISVPGFPTFRDPEALVDRMCNALTRGLSPA